MIDTLRIARTLTDAKLTPEQAEAITAAVREAGDHSQHVTQEGLRAALAELKSDLYRAMLVQAGAIVGALVGIAGIVLGVLRLME